MDIVFRSILKKIAENYSLSYSHGRNLRNRLFHAVTNVLKKKPILFF